MNTEPGVSNSCGNGQIFGTIGEEKMSHLE
jgi:hypothetical protein